MRASSAVGGRPGGQIFTHDIRSLGVEFDTPPRDDVGATARCLILVTPDAQRTMNTFLGAAQMLEAQAVDPARIAAARTLYLEGYLWDPDAARAAMHAAMDAAREAATKVAFTLSDSLSSTATARIARCSNTGARPMFATRRDPPPRRGGAALP